MKENGNGTFPSKVVSNPSKGNFKVNLTVNVQSLVIFGIKNRLCRDNNLCESESKSIKDWYASDETNTVVKTKNDEQLNHMTEQNWLIDSGSNGLTFIIVICLYFFKNSIKKNCKEKLGMVFENHRKSRIQNCERSELRLHFEWTKVN